MNDQRDIVSNIGPNLRPTSRLKYLAIVAAAQDQFLKLGFAAANMDAIAKNADVSKRTVYKHFDDKSALFAAVVKMLCNKIVPTSAKEIGTKDSDLRDSLTEFCKRFLSHLYSKEQTALLRLVISDAHRSPEIGRIMFQQISATEQVVNAYLQQQHDMGHIKLPCIDIAASQLLGLLKTDTQMRFLLGQKRRITRKEIQYIARCCVDVFLDGVAQ